MRNLFFIWILSFAYLLLSPVLTQAEPSSSPSKNLHKSTIDLSLGQAVDRYRKARGIQMDLEKNIFIPLLEKHISSSGTLKVSHGKLRLNLKGPEKLLIVLDGTHLWIETTNASFNVKQVLKIKHSKAQAQMGGLIALLFGENKFLMDLDVLTATTKENVVKYDLVPKKRSSIKDLKKVFISVNKKNKTINELSYTSILGNKTSYVFNNLNFEKIFSASTFQYIPSKNVEVIEIK